MTYPHQSTEAIVEDPEAPEVEAPQAPPEPVIEDPAGPDDTIDPATITPRVEAVLISVDRPIPAGKIADALGLRGAKAVHGAVSLLNEAYAEAERAFTIESLAGGYQVLTRSEFKDDVAALHKTRDDTKLSPSALETLAIIAYKQPVIRAEIEAIRGVASGEMIRSLMDKHLVKITGRAEEVGRPMLYGTTKRFLEAFGLAGLKDLPKAEELHKP